MRTIETSSRRDMRKWYLTILLVTLYASGCRGTKQVDTLQKFAQDGQRTLLEVTDKGGRAWRVGSVAAPGIATYFVISSGGRIDIIATAFDDRRGAKHAIVFVDPANKEEALAVLDRKFLSGIGNASEPYKKWLDQNAVFTYGSVQDTRRFDLKNGLGSSDIRVEGNAIVGRMNGVPCHCDDSVPMGLVCSGAGTAFAHCFTALCDWINCLVDVINGDKPGCAQQASDARTICELAHGVPQ